MVTGYVEDRVAGALENLAGREENKPMMTELTARR
jgi:hypothetical protein